MLAYLWSAGTGPPDWANGHPPRMGLSPSRVNILPLRGRVTSLARGAAGARVQQRCCKLGATGAQRRP
eukprot:scaffold4851_cov428-Prasinococcus_capsulatus_cf.AAC.19